MNLSSDVSIPRIFQLLLERTDLMATTIHLMKQGLPKLQQLAAGSDETMAKVLEILHLESGLQDLMKRVEDLLTVKPASSSRVVPFAGGFLRTVACVKALIERTDDPGSIP